MAEKTYFLINRPQFNAMLIVESGLQAELFGTNGDNGRLVEVTPDAGRISNNGQKVIYKTSAGINPARIPDGVDPSTLPEVALTSGIGLVWSPANQGDDLSQRPPGPPANPGKPARGWRAILMTHDEVRVELEKPEWQSEEQI